jgi:zinc transport system substrate-binding protein
MTWLPRFYEINSEMVRLSLGEKIIPLEDDHHQEGENVESADPHYWVSPVCAITIASSVRDLLTELNQGEAARYESNYQNLVLNIKEVDSLARNLFSDVKIRSFMIFHPNLGYLARDYNLEEITVEHEGKEPSPSRMKELIDLARKNNLKTIFVQKEYDIKNAKAIADEINAVIEIIDPLSENWLNTTTDIINSLHKSMIVSSN